MTVFPRALIGAAACLAVAGAQAQVAACPNPIPIALTTPLTSGIALLGIQAKLGVEQAIDEINAAGGAAGKPFKLAIEDATASAPNALNALNRLMEDKPVVMFSSMISPHIFTQNDAIKNGGTPVLVAGTNAQLMKQGNPWLVRLHVHDGQLADAVPRYVVQTLKKSKPAILAVADDYGLGASKGLQAAFDKLGIKAAAVESYGLNDKDMTAQLTKIKAAGADIILLWGRPGDVAIVLKQRKALGIDLPVIGNPSTVAATTVANLSAEEADGAYGVGGMLPQVSTDPKVLAFAKQVLDKTKVPPDNFAVGYRDAMYMVKSVIDKVGCDRAKIRDGLRAVKDFPGLMISYSADADGELAHTMGIYRNKGKQTEQIGVIKAAGH
ncbi:MAG: ABC transporter substrate-binding protein [Burkholderiaceae bacterium]|nr:ABC transporter substrate-binding protein [Burkholderiaceae bacterium]